MVTFLLGLFISQEFLMVEPSRNSSLGLFYFPSLLVFIWLSVFGNAAIYQEFTTAGSLANAINENISVSLFIFLEQYPGSTLLMGLSLI